MKRCTVTAITALVLAGCSSDALRVKETPEGNQSVANLDEAGSVHVSVIAVTPWNEIKAKLRPNLRVDDSNLRNQAIPVTFALLDKYLDIVRFQAAIAPTTAKTTSTSTTTSATDKDDTSSTETTTTRGPGEPRKIDPVTALTAGSAPEVKASSVSAVNASLTARAMASFAQDIQALNAEVDSAAQRTGYDPYLMRIQVSVMPRRRHLGYDVYSNLSFFGYGGGFDKDTGAARARVPTDGTPFVVPLLSSDSIETAQRSQGIEVLRELGLALDLIKGFGSAGIVLSSQKDRQQGLEGLDINSVLTMGRMTDNTLRVRFGAAFDPGGGFATHPRTNTISVLVFFPKNATLSRVVSRTAWSHVLDGSVLGRAPENYDDRLRPIAEQWDGLGLTVTNLKQIDEFAFEGNYARFRQEMDRILNQHCTTPGAASQPLAERKGCNGSVHRLNESGSEGEKERTYAYVWSHLLSVLPGGRFSTTMVSLPRLESKCPLPSQLAAYVENDKGIKVALRGGQDLAGAKLQAAVHMAYATGAGKTLAKVTSNEKTKSATTAQLKRAALQPTDFAGALFASDMTVSEDRTSVTLSFASDGLEPAGDTKATGLLPIVVELGGCINEKAKMPPPQGLRPLFGDDSQFYMLKAKVPKQEKKEKPPAVALNVSTPNLLLDKTSRASTTVTVDLGEKPTTEFALTAAGADIESASPNESVTRRTDGSYLVKVSGPVDIKFRNLVVKKPVNLDLRPIDENDKLGASAKKLTLSTRISKS
jgi:hypothetical protein